MRCAHALPGAGVELAAVVAERVRQKGLGGLVRVQVVTPGHTILEGSPQGQRQAAEAVLAQLGVEIVTGGASALCMLHPPVDDAA